jgi:hypothetical protein
VSVPEVSVAHAAHQTPAARATRWEIAVRIEPGLTAPYHAIVVAAFGLPDRDRVPNRGD